MACLPFPWGASITPSSCHWSRACVEVQCPAQAARGACVSHQSAGLPVVRWQIADHGTAPSGLSTERNTLPRSGSTMSGSMDSKRWSRSDASRSTASTRRPMMGCSREPHDRRRPAQVQVLRRSRPRPHPAPSVHPVASQRPSIRHHASHVVRARVRQSLGQRTERRHGDAVAVLRARRTELSPAPAAYHPGHFSERPRRGAPGIRKKEHSHRLPRLHRRTSCSSTSGVRLRAPPALRCRTVEVLGIAQRPRAAGALASRPTFKRFGLSRNPTRSCSASTASQDRPRAPGSDPPCHRRSRLAHHEPRTASCGRPW
jgi:hypothetical protein